MVDWRWWTGWSESELESRLLQVNRAALNFPDVPGELVPERGWNHVRSQALIGHEPPGLPLPHGAYARAREAVRLMEFSDPRIVVPHFDPDVPLDERVVLLELRPAGPRFLCPARVGAVKEERSEKCTTWGYSFETLSGHVESGREWFLLSKDHATGDIRFRIEAAWRSGEFPTWWSYLGFQLLGRRYQRAWHRLAHIRLRHITANGRLHAQEGSRLMHHAPEIPTAPVQFHAIRAHAFRRYVEEETEHVRRDRFAFTAGWAWLAGMRSAAPHAFLASEYARAARESGYHDPVLSTLARPGVRKALKVFAIGEMLADKAPFVPDRVSALPLIGRAMSGALAGYGLATRSRRSRAGAAIVGAAVSVASSFATYRGRMALSKRLPKTAAALVEDAAVVLGGALLLGRMRTHRHAAVEPV